LIQKSPVQYCQTSTLWKMSFFFLGHNSPSLARDASFLKFIDHIQWHTTVSWPPLDDWPVTDISTWQHMHISVPGIIQNYICSKQVDTEPYLRALGHWDWLGNVYILKFDTCWWTGQWRSHQISDQGNNDLGIHSATGQRSQEGDLRCVLSNRVAWNETWRRRKKTVSLIETFGNSVAQQLKKLSVWCTVSAQLMMQALMCHKPQELTKHILRCHCTVFNPNFTPQPLLS
jgi:hypothetical protein